MKNNSLRLALFSVVALAMAAPAFAYNLVNTTQTTVMCVLVPPGCNTAVTDHIADFYVSGGTGNGRLQSRIFQTTDGRWAYEYVINMTYVGGILNVPWADQLAIASLGTLRRYDYNADGIATDEVFNITSAGLGTKPVTSAFLSGTWSHFVVSSRVWAGGNPGSGERSHFFGFVSDRAPVLRTVWVHLDTGWVSMQGYAPSL